VEDVEMMDEEGKSEAGNVFINEAVQISNQVIGERI